jgi:phage tail sheath gpL-like
MGAVGTERISKIVGYIIKKGNFSESTQNLPQRIAIFAEANEANQGTLDVSAKEITSAQQAGQLYGYGSPIYTIMRILRPASGDGVGGIPTIVYAQAKASGASAKVIRITPAGIATGNGTHTLYIAGRTNVDGVFYDLNIVTGDTIDDIAAKIEDAVNAVIGSPMSATSTDYYATLTSKWKGLTAQEITVTIDTGDDDLGLSYTIATTATGAGTPSIQAALDLFGNDWNTIVINSYGTHSGTLDLLEQFNGIPDPETPTGRFAGIVMKPFIALTGSVVDDPTSITDARLNEVTIAICPAPGSAGFMMEAAANMAFLFARQAQDNPHLDVADKYYPDMPTPDNVTAVGSMADYENRDSFVKKGCSTVDFKGGKYQVQDFVTTYHPTGELPPQYRYCRNIMIDLNIRFGYYLLEQIHVIDHAIASDADVVSATKVIKPKQWKGILFGFANDLSKRALIVSPSFMQDSITVELSAVNPDRLETTFKYKRSGFARISSTEVEAGFNFGTVN